MKKHISRREFIKKTTVAGSAAAVMPKMLFSSKSKAKIKLGFIGTGLRGQWVLSLAMKYPEIDIPAICDIDEGMIQKALEILKKGGRPEPRVYKKDDHDFQRMLNSEDLEGVYIGTPWEWHHPMSIAAMKTGAHVGVEVPAAISVSQCWDLVNGNYQGTLGECLHH